MPSSVAGSPTSSPSSDAKSQARAAAKRLADDPVLFCRKALGFDPWDKQADILRAAASSKFVAVRSGQKTGKSRSAAALAIWWAVTRPRGRVVLTAPTFSQIKDIVWPELRLLVRDAPVKLADSEPALDPGTGWSLGPMRGVFGRSTDKPTRLQGLSGAEIFFIVDEASGYREALFDALKGNMGGGGRMLLIGNPNEPSGTFYRAFTDQQHLWTTLHIRSTDTPNFHGKRVDGLANPEWLARQREDWGEDSPAYDVRVMGEFPRNSAAAIVPLSLLGAAQERYADTIDTDTRLELGVDVARFGDDEFVIAPRRGRKILPLFATTGQDVPQKVGHVLRVARDLRKPGEKPRVKVDVIGEGGGVVDLLAQHPDEVEVVGVNVAETSDDEERFHNLRTQIMFGVASYLREGGALPNDPKLGGDLVASMYAYDSRGRYEAEPKDEVKKRLKRSPDRGDAVALAIYSGRTRTQRDSVGSFSRGVSIDDMPAGF